MDSPWFQSRVLVEYQTLSAGPARPLAECRGWGHIVYLWFQILSCVCRPAPFWMPLLFDRIVIHLTIAVNKEWLFFFKVSKSNAIDDITITRGQFPTNWHYLHWQWNVAFSESVLPGYHGLFCSVLRNGLHYMLQVQLRTSSSIFYSLWMANGDLVF